MISQIRNSVFNKILWVLMGLYLLNISVDPADPNPEHIAEDLTFNDQESIVEIVIEKILGYENIIEEHDDHDTEDHNKKNNVKIDLLVHLIFEVNIEPLHFVKRKQSFCNFKDYLTNGFPKIDTPPPKI